MNSDLNQVCKRYENKIQHPKYCFFSYVLGAIVTAYIYLLHGGFFSLSDDYSIELIAIAFVSFFTFVLLSVIDIAVNIWKRLNCWFKYFLLMGLFILDWILIYFSAFKIINMLGIHTGCGGGSPLLLAGLIWFYAPIGFFITLMAWFIKRANETCE